MRNGVATLLFCSALLVFCGTAEAVHISGKIVDISNKPVNGAITKLIVSGLTDTTNSDGEFILSDITNIRSTDGIKHPLVSLRGNVLFVNCQRGSLIKIEVFNLQGRTVSYLQQKVSNGGIHKFHLQLDSRSNNVQLMRIHVNDQVQQIRLIAHRSNSYSGLDKLDDYKNQINYASQKIGSQIKNAIDTLLVTCQGFYPEKVPLDSLTGVINVTLTEIVPVQKFRRDFMGLGVIKAKYTKGHYMVVLEKLSALDRLPGERIIELLDIAGTTTATVRHESSAIIDADFDGKFIYISSISSSQDNLFESVIVEKMDIGGHTLCTDTIIKEEKSLKVYDDRVRIAISKSNVFISVFKNDETTYLYARNLNDLKENWSIMVEPDVKRMSWAMTGGSYDEFGQLAYQYTTNLDIDETGNAYVAVPVMGGVGSTTLKLHNKHFGDSLECKSTNTGDNYTPIDVIVTKVSTSGKRVYSIVAGTPYYDEVHCMRIFDNKIITCGRCEISNKDDWDSYITVHDASDGKECYSINYMSAKNSIFMTAAYNSLTKKIYLGGVTDWTQNPEGASVSEQGSKLFQIVNESDGLLSDSVSLTNGPRQNQIRCIEILENSFMLLAGWQNGPGTHSGDSDKTLVTADGFLEVQ